MTRVSLGNGVTPPGAVPRAHARPRREPVRVLAGSLGREAGDPPLFPPPEDGHRARAGWRSHPSLEPPQLPRPVRDRLLYRPANLLRRETRAVQEPVTRLAPQLPRRLPHQARRLRRGIDG